MFKKRMLLLVAALAAFGAVLVGSAAAWPTGQATVQTSDGVSGPAGNGNFVIEEPNISASLSIPNANYTIPPTGAWTPAGTITVTNSTSYTVAVTSVAFVPGLSGACNNTGTAGAQFPGLQPGQGIPAGAYTSAFNVKIGPDQLIDNGCQFNGLVTVNVEQAH